MEKGDMNLKSAINSLLDQLAFVNQQLRDEEYAFPLVFLSGSSIDQYLGYTLGLFDGIENGSFNNVIGSRLSELGKSTEIVLGRVQFLKKKINSVAKSPDLILEQLYGDPSKGTIKVASNHNRELVYSFEHAIYYMTLIKNGIKEIKRKLTLPNGFGVSNSGIKYMEQQNQYA